MTGKDLNIFVVNQHKKRNATRAIYMKQYNNDFQLDAEKVNEFVKWLKND
jgi:hypothetical protein